MAWSSSATVKGITYNRGDKVNVTGNPTVYSSADGTKVGSYNSLTYKPTYFYGKFSTTGYTVVAPYNLGYTSGAADYYFTEEAFPNGVWTVSYNANGGSGAPGSQEKTYGTNLTLSSTKPTRTGYVFKNWNTKSDGTGTSYSSGGPYSSDSNVTLYAQWTAKTYTVSYNANGGTGTMADSTATYNTNFQTRPNTFEKTGYSFNGWNEKSDGTGTVWEKDGSGVATPWKWTYDKDITLYAQWLPNEYFVILWGQGGSWGDGQESDQYKVIFDTTVGGSHYGPVLPTPARPGYNFVEWNTAEDGSGNCYTGESVMNVVGGIVLYAIWKPAASLMTIQIDGQPRRGMMHMYNDNGQLCYAIMTKYDENGIGYFAS